MSEPDEIGGERPVAGEPVGQSEGAARADGSPALARHHSRYHRRMTVRFIFRGAMATFRSRFWRVWGVAAGITITASLGDTAIDWLAEEYEHRLPFIIGVMLVLSTVLLTGVNSFGAVFLSGVLDKTVGEHQHGHREISLREVFRTLPYVTLIVADVLVVFSRAIGFALLVVPGLVITTLTAITGPVIIIEGRSAVSAIRRSAELIRKHFWLAFIVVTIPLTFEIAVEEGIEHLELFHTLFGHTVLGLGVEVPLMTFVALVEVTLAYHLIERDRPGTISEAHSE